MPQLVQDSCWMFSLNFPASQSRHGEPGGECVPIGQAMRQEEAGGMLDFPASQSTQELMLVWREAVVASSVMYFPEGQLVQLVETAEEYFPAEQMLQVALPCSANLPASQSTQMSSEDPGEELESILS